MEVKKLTLREIGYKKLIILFLAGLSLVALSVMDFVGGEEEESETSMSGGITEASGRAGNTVDSEAADYEARLEAILTELKGITAAKVMVTLESTTEKVVLMEKPLEQESVKEEDGAGGIRESESILREEKTVMQGGDGDAMPFITKELEARIAGILILVRRNGVGATASDITEAVVALFEIPAHRVKVLEMN